MATLGDLLERSSSLSGKGKRALDSSDDGGGPWQMAGVRRPKKKQQQQPRTTPPSSTTSTSRSQPSTSSSSKPWFSVGPTVDFPQPYLAVWALEKEYRIKFIVKPKATGHILVQPRDERSSRILSEVDALHGRRLHITVQRGNPSLSKAVVCGFHQSLGLDLLDRVEGLTSPERLKTRAGIQTKQVCVFFKGEIPKCIDLGPWGRFSVRPFVPEPLRCYKCQRFGHIQTRCKNPIKCGVCSGHHDTRECFQKHKDKQATSACCPNCGKKHHAWNLSCPARKAQVSKLGREKPRGPQQQQRSAGSSSSDETSTG